MGKFNWWRRQRPKAKLDRKKAKLGVPFILQQIEHGDFDHSDFKRQAEQELVLCEQTLATFVKNYKGSAPTLDDRYLEIERKFRKRYNKLMEDYHKEEVATLMELRVALIKHFEVDVWDETVQEAFKRDTIGAKDFYFLYNELTNKYNASTSKEVTP
jgi:hypothetical protein